MKNLNAPKFTLSIPFLVILLFTIGNIKAQDFILTKNNELIECNLVVDSSSYILYRKGSERIQLGKSSIEEYAKASKRKRPALLEITNTQGSRLRGSFLAVGQDSLYFWKGSKVYHPNKGTFYAIGINEVEQLVIHRKGGFWKGFTTGAILGGSFGLIVGLDSYGFVTGSPSEDVLLGIALFGGTASLLGGLIGSISNKHIQFNDPKNEMMKALPLIQRNAMLLTPPIKTIGRDTLEANWISEELTLYKSKKR